MTAEQITIDSELSDDWIRQLPGYKDEVAIHDKLAVEFEAQEKAEKGSPDSGYHKPHYGRPGEIGGSKPRSGPSLIEMLDEILGPEGVSQEPEPTPESTAESERLRLITQWETEATPGPDGIFRTKEAGLIVDANGNEIWRGEGEESSLHIPEGDYKGATLTHYHPTWIQWLEPDGRPNGGHALQWDPTAVSQSFSDDDFLWASTNGLKEIRAVGYWEGKRVVFRFTFAPTYVHSKALEQSLDRELNWMKMNMLLEYNREQAKTGRVASGKVRAFDVHDFWVKKERGIDGLEYAMELADA